MAQHLWGAVGFCKPTVLSFTLCSISRVFCSFHSVKAPSSDPVKRKAQYDKRLENNRLKRVTDPEWTLHNRALHLKACTKHKAKWTYEHLQEVYQKEAERKRTRRVEDPKFRLKEWLSKIVRRHAWTRERLPWKTHYPVLYQDKVQHTCSTCLVPRFGGGYKLWWASHDGEHYQCGPCYLNGSNVMPKGYENVSSMPELRKRMEELGH